MTKSSANNLLIIFFLLLIFQVELICASGEEIGWGTVRIIDVVLNSENNFEMKPGRLVFDFNEKKYAIQLRRVGPDYSDFLVMTLDMDNLDDITAHITDDSFSLEIGGTKNIDLNKDDIEDFTIKLNTIIPLGEYGSIKAANFSINKIELPEVLEYDCVIANSENWEDVYSIMLYADLEELSSDFLASSDVNFEGSLNIPECKNALIISNIHGGYIEDYTPLIDKGYIKSFDQIKTPNANLDLINKLPEINNFIIVDGRNNYNALSVISYAVATNSWVFISNGKDDEDIEERLKKSEVEEILFYGNVNEELKSNLQNYHSITINNGNKYLDNIEIVRMYLELKKESRQCILTSGEFLESEMQNGIEPIVFVGEDMPDEVINFLNNSILETGLLIGNESMGEATVIRRSTGMSVMVKFARGIRETEASNRENAELKKIYLNDSDRPSEEKEEVKEPEKEIEKETKKLNSCKDGCSLNDTCYPLGYRNEKSFCSGNLSFIFQKNESGVCNNNFECESNVCVSGKCVSSGSISKILSWFKNIFG